MYHIGILLTRKLVKLTDLFHSMGHIVERCAVLSVVCRHTFVIHADAVQRALHLRHTAVAKTASTLRHSFAPTPCTSGMLAQTEGLEPSLTRFWRSLFYQLNYVCILAGIPRVGLGCDGSKPSALPLCYIPTMGDINPLALGYFLTSIIYCGMVLVNHCS